MSEFQTMAEYMFENYTKDMIRQVGDKVTCASNFLADKISEKIMRKRAGDTIVYLDPEIRDRAGITRDPCSIDEYIVDMNKIAAAINENAAKTRQETIQLQHRISNLYAGVMQAVAAQQHMTEAQSMVN